MKLNLVFACLFFLCINSYAQIPDWSWAMRSGGAYEDEVGGICTDAHGNIYHTGIDGLGGFIRKYDFSGNLLWNNEVEGISGGDVVCDHNGNVIVTGYAFGYEIVFGNVTLINDWAEAVYIVKYNPSGNLLWVKLAGGVTYSDRYSVAIDGNNDIYVSGTYYDEAFFNNITLVSYGYEDIFTAKYSASGNVIWAKSAGGNGHNDQGSNIFTDTYGNSYITGDISSDTFYLGDLTLTDAGGKSFFAKYNSAGVEQWVKTVTNATCRGITVDSEGNIYITGTYWNQTDLPLSNNGGGVFIAKYDSSGNLLWAKEGQCIYSDDGEDISCDIHGNLYVTGTFENEMSFEGITLQNSEMHNLFVAKYDSEGNLGWAKSAAGSSTVNYIFDQVKGICNDNNGNIYITGIFGSPTISFDSITLTRQGQESDIFIAKLYSPIPCSANFILYPDSVTEHLWNLVASGYGMQPVSYYWEWGDGTSSTGASPSHTYSVPGYYPICLTTTDGNGCSANYCDSSTYVFKTGTEMITVNVINKFTTGIEDEISTENILVYPNPASDLVIVETDVTIGIYQLHDVTGKLLLSGNITNTKFYIDISAYSKGIYFISLFNDKEYLHKKIIKE